jgi:hypothetical protein
MSAYEARHDPLLSVTSGSYQACPIGVHDLHRVATLANWRAFGEDDLTVVTTCETFMERPSTFVVFLVRCSRASTRALA